jgi:hypothetical protein
MGEAATGYTKALSRTLDTLCNALFGLEPDNDLHRRLFAKEAAAMRAAIAVREQLVRDLAARSAAWCCDTVGETVHEFVARMEEPTLDRHASGCVAERARQIAEEGEDLAQVFRRLSEFGPRAERELAQYQRAEDELRREITLYQKIIDDLAKRADPWCCDMAADLAYGFASTRYAPGQSHSPDCPARRARELLARRG